MKKMYLLLIGLLAISLLVGGCAKGKTATAGKAVQLYEGDVESVMDKTPLHLDMCDEASLGGSAPMHYWHLGESSGNIAYDSVSKNHGTLKGAARFGTDDVFFPHPNNGPSWIDIQGVSLIHDFTIEFWAQPDTTNDKIDNKDAIVGQDGSGPDINFYAGKLRLWAPGDKIVANTPAKGKLVHWAINRKVMGSVANLTIYRNGVMDSSTSSNWVSPFTFSAIGRGNAGYFYGEITRLAVWNYTLNGNTIKDHYDYGLQGKSYCGKEATEEPNMEATGTVELPDTGTIGNEQVGLNKMGLCKSAVDKLNQDLIKLFSPMYDQIPVTPIDSDSMCNKLSTGFIKAGPTGGSGASCPKGCDSVPGMCKCGDITIPKGNY